MCIRDRSLTQPLNPTSLHPRPPSPLSVSRPIDDRAIFRETTTCADAWHLTWADTGANIPINNSQLSLPTCCEQRWTLSHCLTRYHTLTGVIVRRFGRQLFTYLVTDCPPVGNLQEDESWSYRCTDEKYWPSSHFRVIPQKCSKSITWQNINDGWTEPVHAYILRSDRFATFLGYDPEMQTRPRFFNNEPMAQSFIFLCLTVSKLPYCALTNPQTHPQTDSVENIYLALYIIIMLNVRRCIRTRRRQSYGRRPKPLYPPPIITL